MQNRYPVALLDPAAAGIEMDEMMDDDDYYDFSEDGPDDGDSVEDEVAAHLGMPVDSFASMVAARTPITWRQFSELMSGSNRERAAMARAVASSRGSPWEDDATVKCTFEALIPAFDPRPGRSNVNQTLEVELPTVVKDFGSTKASSSKIDKDDQMRFFLRGPNMSGVDNVTIEMNDDSASLFRYMQIINNSVNWATKSDRSRRIWEPTYSICYCSADQTNVEVSKIPDEESSTPCQVNQCLETIGLLSRIQQAMPEAEITPNVFISDKLTLKVTQVLSDALVVAARSLPEWCSRLVYKYPCLFTVETRNMYMQVSFHFVRKCNVSLIYSGYCIRRVSYNRVAPTTS